jgi:beta-glucosidase
MKTFVLLIFSLLLSPILRLNAEESRSPYPSKYPTSVVEERAEKLLSQLTLEEKIRLLAGDSYDGMSTEDVPRLHIPKLIMADGPQGIRAHGPACSFPSGIALAATWDPHLAYLYGEALGREARARDIHIQLGPGVNIARIPLNGRNFEYYGEDPYLTGVMAASWIKGLQSQGVAATVKHFVGNDEEWRRMEIESVMDEQVLREIYLQPFQKALQEGGAWTVMSAYNRINGSPSTANEKLQNGILKGEWGFSGVVMSDWWATQSVDSIAKGLDLEMPMNYRVNEESVTEALKDHSLTLDRIDDAVKRLLRMMISMGFLDRKQQQSYLPLHSPLNDAVALDVATKSIVLLKNSPAVLPLDPARLKCLVVYGPNAQDTPAVGGGSGNVTPFQKVSFLEGIRDALPNARVFYAPMPLTRHFSISDFLDFTKPDFQPPQITGIRRLVSFSDKNVTRLSTDHPSRIELSWTPHSHPLGIPKDKEGRVTWDAEIEFPESGNYELYAEGHPEIRLGDKELGTPESYVLTAKKGDRIPIRVTASEVGRYTRSVSVRLTQVADEATGVFPARSADAAIVCVGLNPDVEGEGYDRGFSLPLEQQQLITKVAAANPHTIVVLSGGGAVDMRAWIDQVPSVLQTWYLGQSAGTALASILFGKENPSGHLPCTFDRNIEDNPSFHDYPGVFPEGKDSPVVTYHEGIFYGYRGYDREGKDPLFPFGHGLSYTSFSMEGMEASPVPEGYQVSLKVTNTGHLAGATVVQIYVSLTGESTPRPLRELKGFQRVDLKAGESRTLSIPIPATSLLYWHPRQNCWVPPQGTITLEAGFSERDIRQSVTITSPNQKPEPIGDKNVTSTPRK